MFRSILMALVAGSRSMTPLAVATHAARHGRLPANDLPVHFLASDLARAGSYAMAAGELAGDKMKTAPDRIVPLGMAARLISSTIAGAALVEPKKRVPAAIVSAAVASASAYATWRLRCRAMETYGQTRTGLVEDAIVVASAAAIANLGRSRPAGAQLG